MTEAALDDDGLTLIEVIVYVVLAAVLAAVISAIFINGWMSQAATADRDVATGNANAVAATLQKSIRNAEVVSPSGGSTDILVALVATGDGGWECQAWHLDGGVVFYKASGHTPPALDSSGWVSLMAARGQVKVSGGEDGAMFDVVSPTQVDYSFEVTVNEAVIPVVGSVAAQGKVRGGGGPCW